MTFNLFSCNKCGKGFNESGKSNVEKDKKRGGTHIVFYCKKHIPQVKEVKA